MSGKSYLTLGPSFPIGIRRNNPGNLAKTSKPYPGVTTRPDTGRGAQFLAFVDMAHGLLAMHLLLAQYLTSGLNTIPKLSQRYLAASTSVRERNRWIADVTRYSGLYGKRVLTTSSTDMRSICLSIAMKETGLKWTRGGVTATITDQDYNDAMTLLASYTSN